MALSLASAEATCGGGGGGGMGGIMPQGAYGQQPSQRGRAVDVYVVPWKVLSATDKPIDAPVTLYWFPKNEADLKGHELVSSRMLTLYSAQCIGMQAVKPDDAATIAKFELPGKLPAALLVSDGKVIGRVDNDKGELRSSDVENLVHHELYLRETALDRQLADGDKKASSGDREGAVAAYRKVWEQRCLAPKQGRAAQRALKKLGVVVKDASLRESDPIMTKAMDRTIRAAMSKAFAAEVAENYELAKRLYIAASQLDPSDPVPLRFLGELYRHHTGEWTLARQTFDRILAIQPDPLSRAVALHGLGKMTIHMGDSAKGLDLFEQSIASYPLALTYRNMAVYWNSERQRARADGYVEKALALDPKDPYNLIFAATYMADSDRRDEALRIAKENEGVLSASYNLAAIYALLGEKGKALDLLKRHFYRYERYDAVRGKEMWEARVDYVFASIKDDPAFVELTKDAN
ncbi:MAG TPA: tetratricopeptide repeat protein [Thermoanaerobaculia bacterium]